MDRNTLNSFEEKGLPCPFVATKKGDVEIAQSGAALSKQVSQMATVIFETIGAVGDIKVDAFEIMGSGKGLIMTLGDDRLAGTIFGREQAPDNAALRGLLKEVHVQAVGAAKPAEPAVEAVKEVAVEEPVSEEVAVEEHEVEAAVVAAPEPEVTTVEAPAKAAKTQLGPEILENIKTAMKDFLGDFTERIFKNQIKAQRINVDELYDDDARRLIFALGKAAGMIIGPSKGRDMTNKLLEILK